MNTKLVEPCPRRTISMLLLAITASAGTAIAQTKPQETINGSTVPATETEETIVLSPFEVSSTRDTGYAATETLAGTRIRTELKDVGSAIGVVTKEFMQDIGATNSSTLLQYTTNAEVAGTRGTYAGMGSGQTLFEGFSLSGNQRLRGLGPADNTRDYFLTDIPWDSFNVDRVDIQRGPNSILFGLGSPAGIINASTRNADFANKGNAEFRIGSYGSNRASFGVNQQLIKNVLAVRVDGLWSDQKFQQEPAFQKDKRLYGALRWDPKIFGPGFNTSIKIKGEHGEITANRPRTSTPYDSITPWFKSTAEGGAGGITVNDLYALGSNASTTSPWLRSISGQQTPTYFINGNNAQVYSINAGYINNGFLNNNGTLRGPGDNAVGQRYSEIIYGLGGYQDYAFNAKLPYYNYAQYKNKMLTDPSVFNFYDKLIDGNNKGEGAQWDAYNITVSQTGWKDRVGIEFAYDYQKYESSNWSLLGGAPAINIDVTRIMQDGSTNPNYGRAFLSSTAGGTGSAGLSERESLRASAYAEIRASDFLDQGLLTKILGRHRFNGVASEETNFTETRNYNRYANDNRWDAFTTRTNGYSNLFTNRAPVSLVYLTPALSAASGSNIPRIGSNVRLNDGPVYLFDSTWIATTVQPSDPYTIPPGNTQLNRAFNPALVTSQASNQANYRGWNNGTHLNTLAFDEGEPLYTSATKRERVVTSYAGTWQGFLWNESIVPIVGWRYDTVKTRSKNALPDNINKGYLKLDDYGYSLPDFQPKDYYKEHSLSGGVVFHLNKAIAKNWDDSIPLNISLTYNDSSNFQALSARVDMYNNRIENPQGKTRDYGVLLATKDNKFSLRAIKYETEVSNATVSTNSGFSNPVVQGLKFRNVFLYRMTGYTWDTRRPYNDPGPTFNNRNYWSQSYVDANGRPVQTINYLNDPNQYGSTVPSTSVGLQTLDQAAQHRDASIRAWNNIQNYLSKNGYFAAWGYTPTTASALTDRATYEASLDPATNLPTNPQYMPEIATLQNYGGTAPAGYAITGDTQSEGYEFELTANVTRNWRLAFNASKTTATSTNIGNAALNDFVTFMDAQMAGVAGDMRQFNGDYTANNEVRKNSTTGGRPIPS
ncbi:MAG: TonB-dependent receptor plug domain-containing protein [Nibricoccus sp.]